MGGEIAFLPVERGIRRRWSLPGMNAFQQRLLRSGSREKQTVRRRFRRCLVYTGVWTIHSGSAQRTCSMRNYFVLGSMLTVAVGNAAASAEVIFNSIPDTLAANYIAML